MKKLLYLFCFAFSMSSHAVVKRHDVPSENYELEKAPEYLIDMPHEGHGVLIDPQWILTVAHTIFYDYEGKNLKIGAKVYQIEEVNIHPSYVKPSEHLFIGDAAALMNFLRARSDIALIKLSTPVSHIKPISIYADDKEQGKQITVFGRGAIGNGITGEIANTKKLRKINHFTNIVTSTDGNWLSFQFDSPTNALPLEGVHGSGDSGGASVIFENGKPYLVGLSSWQFWEGELASFKGGLYGTTAYQVRVSAYRNWISGLITR